MDERRGDQPAAGSARAVPRQIRAGTPLSPVQQTHGEFSNHFMGCEHCRDTDLRGYCGEGARLWAAYQAEDRRAHERMAEETT